MIVYFIRGLPGSGKSTLAKELEEAFCGPNYDMFKDERPCWHVEADQWMYNSKDEYEFDWKKLPYAHAACFAEYCQAIEQLTPYVIVSNVSAEEEYINQYKEIADKKGYQFVSLIVENRHGSKSVHDVPDKSMENMRKKFSISL